MPKTFGKVFAQAAVLLALGIGCGDGGGSNPDAPASNGPPAQDAATRETGGAALPYCTDKPALAGVTDLSGTWVARAVGSQIVKAPVVGHLQVKSLYYLLLDISQTGAEVAVEGRYCDRREIDDPHSPTPVTIPDAWAHTEKTIHRTGTFAAGSDGIPVLRLPATPESVEFVGARLLSVDEPLPTLPTDPRVIDEDNDRHPGITVRIAGMVTGSIYAVQRQTTAVTAIPVGADRVEGALDFSSTQNVLASDPATVALLYSQSVTVPDPVACNSTFTMVRVAGAGPGDGGGLDAAGVDGGAAGDGGGAPGCAWVREHEVDLFPSPP